MSWKTVSLIIVFAINIAVGRVYYVDNIDNLRNNNPVFGNLDNFEQSSRDLDLSFSAGDSDDSNDLKDHIRPIKKVYNYAVPGTSLLNVNKDIEHPATYYKIFEFPTGRTAFEEVLPNFGRNRKFMKNNVRKGEVILEIRVIANNDASE
ncbi:uncharacterized protein LOC107265275 [Cephus cinctus]|uniref:Uncharacterized protein LOC107265275 n=1 Tax=Cephus cinctus TaxID=211228 RepID=A0AAJ7BMV5_CEPCN|nr:uncharacterized protein LOC107265275 [Cephus cinctus]